MLREYDLAFDIWILFLLCYVIEWVIASNKHWILQHTKAYNFLEIFMPIQQ